MSKRRIKTFTKVVLSFASVALLGGCAVGNKHAYHDANAITSTHTDKSLAVASLDRRPYVVAGKSSPDFVGMQRGGFGNPFDVLTVSGRPLSSEFSNAIRTALIRNGANVIVVETQPASDNKAAFTSLVATHRERLLLLDISEWVSDTFQNTGLGYTLNLAVTDSTGKELAYKTLKADLNLGGSAINPPGYAKEVIPPAFRQAIEQLLNNPEIAAALK